jgi:hypothetical protein
VADRLEVLSLQLQTSWFMLWAGLEGLSEQEYAWQPAADCWTIRMGPDGHWARDGVSPGPGPRPVPTIAWRICTLAGLQALRTDWTFGGHSLTWDLIDLPGSVSGGLAFLERSAAAWLQGVAGLTDADLDQALCDWPGGPTDRPFAETLWWTNRELIAAGAEIALLRDLHRAGPPRPG